MLGNMWILIQDLIKVILNCCVEGVSLKAESRLFTSLGRPL
jgi:hypothetical protein